MFSTNLLFKNISRILHEGAKTHCEDMNVIFKWQNIVFYHEKIKYISLSRSVIFFLLDREEYFYTTNSVKGAIYLNFEEIG